MCLQVSSYVAAKASMNGMGEGENVIHTCIDPTIKSNTLTVIVSIIDHQIFIV